MEKPTLFIVGNTSSFMVHFVMLVYWSVPTPQQNMSMSSNHHFNQGISLLDMATLRSPGLKSWIFSGLHFAAVKSRGDRWILGYIVS